MGPLLLSRNVAAPRELLWRYLSTPEGLASWQADTVEGGLESGEFRLRWPQLGARMDLRVTDVDEGRRVVLQSGDSQLEMEAGEGRVTLSHHGLHPEDDLVGLESSWMTALSLLRVAATRHPEKKRFVRWLFHPIGATAELAHHYFTDAQGLSQWLGVSNHHLVNDRRFRMTTDRKLILSGEVLSADRDVCLRVEELGDGAMALRTLPGPDGERVAAVGLSAWGHEVPEEVVELMEQALARLARLAPPGIDGQLN